MKMLFASSLIAAIGQVHAESAKSENESAIRAAVNQYSSAWNNHDAKAMARIFAQDADFIGGSGGRVNRAAFEKTMAEEHATVFKDRKLTTTVEQIRFLKPDIGIVDGSYQASIRPPLLPSHSPACSRS
jgi:uncharacterized protein (TIGR02246 family)